MGMSSLSRTALSFIDSFGFFFFFFFLGPYPWAYGGSQARGPVRAVATDLHHSHSKVGSELHVPPTPQLMAMQNP